MVLQVTLQQQSSDALVINIAGRQRMLSQRLSKAALRLKPGQAINLPSS